MTIVFGLSLLVIVYTYAGYPIAIATLAQFYPRPWKRRRWWLEGEKPVSIVLAVHNGAARMAQQVEHLLTLEPEIVSEVIIVSDGSTDATNALLAEAAQEHKDPRLKTILLETQRGKACALNAAMEAATGEVVLFVDIRPQITRGAIAELLANFADASVGCVAGELRLLTSEHDATATAVSGLYWRYEQALRNAESTFDSPVGVYGGFYAVRRELLREAPDGIILDDMFQPLSVIRQGYRSVVDVEAIVTDVWPTKAQGEFARKVRTLAGNFQLLRLCPWTILPSNRVLFQLVSHKLLRLAVPYFFLLLLISSLVLGAEGSVLMEMFAILQLLFWAMAALALRWTLPLVGRVAAPASALLMLNAAAVVALYRYVTTPEPLWKALWSPTGAAELSSTD